MNQLETVTIAKVTRRLIPFLIVCYFVAFLDRVNVGFAAITMNKDLGLSASAFGLGAGIFFLSYFVFEVPSNLMLERFGARRWIARIMFTWGILSGAMAFIPQLSSATGLSTTSVFYIIRVLLGAAEAGFFPGVIFFLTLWFPSVYRGRIVGYFMAAIPLSSVIGGPLSGQILATMDGVSGLAGWQWLFIVEAAPALVLTIAVLTYLTDRPAEATWLEPAERTWLAGRLSGEMQARKRAHDISILQALTNPRVLALSVVYFGAVATNYGLSFWLPQIIAGFGYGKLATGLIFAIPYAVGTVGMVWWGRRSDAKLERKVHAAIPLLIAGAGIFASTFLADPTLKMVALAIAGFGIFAVLPVFWTLPTAFLSGASAAAGIAAINSLGNLAGFAGPYAIGVIKDATGSVSGGLWLVAAVSVLGAVVVMGLRHDTALEQAPPAQAPRMAAE